MKAPDSNKRPPRASAAWQLPACLALFLIYQETAFILGLFGDLEWRGYLVCLAFSAAAGLLAALLAAFFRPVINKIVTVIICGGLTALFVAQVIYYSLFTTFFSLYSMSAGGMQVMQFWGGIVATILRNRVLILILVLPLLALLVFGLRQLDFRPAKPVHQARRAGLMLAAFLLGLVLLRIPSANYYSPLKLYDQTFSSALGVHEFGLLTTLRLDLQRTIFGTDDLAAAATSLTASPTPAAAMPSPAASQVANQWDIDFAALIQNETDPDIQAMHRYFQSVEPTPKNEYTGLFQGKNLIMIVAESFTPLAIRADITPTLYKLAQEGINFTNFYTPIWPVSTSDGEYTSNLSLIPSDATWSMTASAANRLPLAMGRMLLARGYRTLAFHDHNYDFYQRNLSHPNLGYQTFKAVGSGLSITSQWPESDLEMIQATTGDYLGQTGTPFAVYYMTVSGHLEYSQANAMARKNWQAVENLAYSDPVKAYLACNIELDKALAELIADLEAAGQAEDTVIALCADHYPYGLSRAQISELKGRPVTSGFDLFENTCLIWHPGIEPLRITQPGSNLDILPTLANLFGLPYDSRLLMGRDLLADTSHLVIFANRSWLNSQGTFNSLTGEFTAFPGQTAPDTAAIRKICQLVDDRFAYSTLILKKNYYASLGPAGS